MSGPFLFSRNAALLAAAIWTLTLRNVQARDGQAGDVQARDAQARDAQARDAQARDVDHRTSITLATVGLLNPVVRLTAEFALPYRFSVAGTAGAGWGGGADWMAGAQVRYYLLGDFNHGMPIFVQPLYRWGESSAFLLSPMIGYKLALRIGFTLDLAAGAKVTFAGTGRHEDDPRVWPQAILNVGWSF